MSNLPGFQKVGGGVTKFSELEMDKTFDESMKQLNQGSTEYDWFFTKLHNTWTYQDLEENTYTADWTFHTNPVSIPGIDSYHSIMSFDYTRLGFEGSKMRTVLYVPYEDGSSGSGSFLGIMNQFYGSFEDTTANLYTLSSPEFIMIGKEATTEGEETKTKTSIDRDEITINGKRVLTED